MLGIAEHVLYLLPRIIAVSLHAQTPAVLLEPTAREDGSLGSKDHSTPKTSAVSDHLSAMHAMHQSQSDIAKPTNRIRKL